MIKIKTFNFFIATVLFYIVVAACTACNFRHAARQNLDVTEIDSCEYIEYNDILIHKGNCKYCIERQNRIQQIYIESLEFQVHLLQNDIIEQDKSK